MPVRSPGPATSPPSLRLLSSRLRWSAEVAASVRASAATVSMLVACSGCGNSRSATAPTSVMPPSGGAATVRVLYVMPQDRPLRNDYYAAVQNALRDVRTWYASQLEGRTFSLFGAYPETCQLPGTADGYASDTWSKVFADVQPCAPVSYNSASVVWVLYVDVVHACGAPGRLGAGTRGVTMLARQDMDGLIGAPFESDCGVRFDFPPSRYVGGLAHELGHAFGLSHPPGCNDGLPTCDRNALMWTGYIQYPFTYLRPEDEQVLLATPFFR